jgi:phage portal protein BeeE
LLAIAIAYPEAPLRVYKAATDPGKRDLLPESPFQQLLDEPNPHMGAEELWFWIQWAKHCDGNAYVRKVRSGNPETGNVVELWPISPG